ncbi:Hypothetical predicted protein, partial [Pelobates cultripes]
PPDPGTIRRHRRNTNEMGNPKRQTQVQGQQGRTPIPKSGSLTRYFKDNIDQEMEAATSKMADADPIEEMQPQSPHMSDYSLKSLDNSGDLDIKEMLRNLPSKADLQTMMGKLEATLHTKLAEMGTEIQQMNLKVTDLEEEKDVMQAQILNISSTLESHIHFMSATQRHIDDLDNRGRRNNLRIRGIPEAQNEDLTAILTELFTLVIGDSGTSQMLIDRAHRSLRPKGLP